MVEGHQALLVQELLDGLAVLTVHQHLYTLSQERAADLSILQPKNALFAGHVGDIHQLFNAGLGFRQLELEGPGGRFEGAKKLGDAELGQHHEHGATHDNQQ